MKIAARSASDVLAYEAGWGLPPEEDRAAVHAILRGDPAA